MFKFIGNIVLKAKISKYMSYGFPKEASQDDEPVVLDVVTVAFNNWKTIKYQFEFLSKNLNIPYRYIVFDNSSDDDESVKIKETCIQLKASYYKLPINPYLNREEASNSHGCALNWITKNYLIPRRKKYNLILDHDIYPINTINEEYVEKSLQSQDVYGVFQSRDDKWYIWPGLFMCTSNFYLNKEIDFRPKDNLDTGGGIWRVFYSKVDRNKMRFAKEKNVKIDEGGNLQHDEYMVFDDVWLHMVNASGWFAGKDKMLSKEEYIYSMLDGYLQKDSFES